MTDNPYQVGLEEGRSDERATIIAFLRWRAAIYGPRTMGALLDNVADSLARGEHCTEVKWTTALPLLVAKGGEYYWPSGKRAVIAWGETKSTWGAWPDENGAEAVRHAQDAPHMQGTAIRFVSPSAAAEALGARLP